MHGLLSPVFQSKPSCDKLWLFDNIYILLQVRLLKQLKFFYVSSTSPWINKLDKMNPEGISKKKKQHWHNAKKNKPALILLFRMTCSFTSYFKPKTISSRSWNAQDRIIGRIGIYGHWTLFYTYSLSYIQQCFLPGDGCTSQTSFFFTKKIELLTF